MYTLKVVNISYSSFGMSIQGFKDWRNCPVNTKEVLSAQRKFCKLFSTNLDNNVH